MGLLPLRSLVILLAATLPLELGFLLLSYLIPSTPIPLTSFYGNYFSWQKPLIFFSMVLIGYVFVAALNRRRNLLQSRRRSYKEVMKLMGVACVTFFFVPIRTMHSLSDDPTPPATFNLLHPLFPSSQFESILYNYFCYILPFYIGLHFRYLDKVPILSKMFYKVTFPPSVGNYGPREYLVLLLVILLILSFLGFHTFLFIQSGLWKFYLPIFFGSILVLALVTFFLRRTHYLHLHHYFIFGFFFLFTPFQNIGSAISQALLAGAAVEGISTWGMDPLFIRRSEEEIQNRSRQAHLLLHHPSPPSSSSSPPPPPLPQTPAPLPLPHPAVALIEQEGSSTLGQDTSRESEVDLERDGSIDMNQRLIQS